MSHIAIINIKTDPKVKKEAQLVAAALGLSLSSAINGYLRQLIRSRKVDFSLEDNPTPELMLAVRDARKEYKTSKTKRFADTKKALKFLDTL